ncbi:EndoU domain-containing protein [Nitrosomonas sp. Nm166]|uniref:EndoU domain-containing protein n=1 Tax=Nitrosomonas sp. Nm166 TaxID=1881054 RepID=UPI0015A673AA|nr:EndoU domain-containing protein [Nitrosomonas sp. Nm166]
MSTSIMAKGIDCATLSEWSETIDGYQLNQRHVFCGEVGKKNKAKGFHAMPDGNAPSNYINSSPADPANGAGVYTLKQIQLRFAGKQYEKSFSSIFPQHCSQTQVSKSIVYSLINRTGACASPGWASCGPNAPKDGGNEYCLAANGAHFDIATAVLPGNKTRINTGFPIYKP